MIFFAILQNTYIKPKSRIIFIGNVTVLIILWPSIRNCHQTHQANLEHIQKEIILGIDTTSLIKI